MINSFPQPDYKVLVLDDPAALAREAATRFVRGASRAVDRGGRFRVALSGGKTPLETFRTLAAEPYRFAVHWGSVEVFWADERFVPADHADSNFGAARRELLDRLPVPPAGVFPVDTGAASVEEAAAAYAAALRAAFAIGPDEVPRFDLVFLGLGEDGHTASLFPGALPPGDRSAVAAGVHPPQAGSPRVTLTPATFNAAAEVVFLVTGTRKAEALERVLRAEEPDPAIPASLVRPLRGKVHWLADRAAAARVVEGEESPGAKED